MKLKFITPFAVLVFVSTAFVGMAHARNDETHKACIPFDFYAGKQKKEAGCYRIGIDLENGMISFTDESGAETFLIAITEDEGKGEPMLGFTHSGDVYALEELKGNAYNWMFKTWMPQPPIESRNGSVELEVALSR